MLPAPRRVRSPAKDESVRSDSWLAGLSVGTDTIARPAAPSGQNAMRIALIALIALVMFGPLMTISENATAGEGSVVRQIGYMLIFGLTIYSIRQAVTGWSFVSFPWPMLLALTWCWASLFWALDPGVAARRVLLTTLTAWMVFALVRHGGYRMASDVLRFGLFGAVLLSYLFVAVDPPTGIHLAQDSAMPTALIGNWRGFLGHKNFAGAVGALCIIMFLFDARRISIAIRVIAIAVAAYFLLRTQSKTSAGMLFLASIGGLIFEYLGIRMRSYLIPILTVGGAAIGVVTSVYGDFVQANFLNPTAFTGRGQIWGTLLRYSADHPMLGAGFGSFWNIEAGSPVFQYSTGYVAMITVGHSGYMDQLVTVGVPGLVLMVAAVVVWPLAKLLMSQGVEKGQGALISAMLMFCIGHNVTESGLFERDMIVSTIFFFAVAFAQYCVPSEKYISPEKRAADDMMLELRQRRKERRKQPGSQAQ